MSRRREQAGAGTGAAASGGGADAPEETRGGAGAAGDEREPGSAEKLREERADDAALRQQENLNPAVRPSDSELAAAAAQAAKPEAVLLQEQADAISRQSASADATASFQPPPGQKPRFVKGGAFVNPDGRRATERNLEIIPEDEE